MRPWLAVRMGVAVLPLVVLGACATGMEPGAAIGSTSDTNNIPADRSGASSVRGLDEPSRLKGMTATQVKAALGAPGFTRRDAPAEIWQYRSGRCTLDLFLYDGATGQVVETYDVRASQPLAEKDCLQGLAQLSRAGN